MIEKMKYVNHLGETLEFGTFPLFVNYNDLRDFAWEVTSKNDRIASFKKGIVSKSLPVTVKCTSEEEGYEIRNRIFEITEKDVLAEQYGRIVIGDYYLKCYVTGSKKTEYLISKDYMTIEMTVQTDLPSWIKETTVSLRGQIYTDTAFLDYPFDYAIDYMSVQCSGIVTNPNFAPSNFRMVIYGEVLNPTIVIGGHLYNVQAELAKNEYLTIDSAEKTIVLTRSNGEKVNCFSKRNRESYVFEKIQSGSNMVSALNGDIFWDITLLDERSEPKWT